jgi:hypothetical protein
MFASFRGTCILEIIMRLGDDTFQPECSFR